MAKTDFKDEPTFGSMGIILLVLVFFIFITFWGMDNRIDKNATAVSSAAVAA